MDGRDQEERVEAGLDDFDPDEVRFPFMRV
jgi:hypothetical protein